MAWRTWGGRLPRRRPTSNAASRCSALTGPTPGVVHNSPGVAEASRSRVSYRHSSSVATSRALRPDDPVRSSTAINSAELSAALPSVSSRSRGRSSTGRSFIRGTLRGGEFPARGSEGTGIPPFRGVDGRKPRSGRRRGKDAGPCDDTRTRFPEHLGTGGHQEVPPATGRPLGVGQGRGGDTNRAHGAVRRSHVSPLLTVAVKASETRTRLPVYQGRSRGSTEPRIRS